MFYLWREAYDPKYPKFCVVKFQERLGMQQYDRYESLAEIIDDSSHHSQYEHHFLLDDGRFHFFRFDIYKETESVFTIEDLNAVIEERLEYLRNITKEELLFTNIDTIFVDGEPQKFVIWAKGKLFFRLYFIYINRNTLLEFNKAYGNVFNQKNLHLRPESFKTISFLKRKLDRDAFLLLYIKENYCKVVAVEDGFYKQIEHINFGINFLMQMYKDNQIVKYRYKSAEEVEHNPLAKNLVLESIRFYVEYLCKWLNDLHLTNKDIFLVSPIVKNGNFMEEFNKSYTSFHNKYIVPFHHSSQLELFGKHRAPEDMDTVIFLNGAKIKNQIIGERK